MADIYNELQWRGLVYQETEGVATWLNEKPRTVYAGFDPTADSLHAGSLLGLMYLRRFQRMGHRPICIVGGATGMIGDPSGKSQERNLLSVEALRANVIGIEKQMRQFLDFEAGDSSAILVNTFDWPRKFSYLDFLRDVGKNCPVNVMLAKDSVKSRLGGESGMSYTEFSYMLLQAYDFVHLNREYGCEIQVGGSDQWGNITAGIDLGRRMNRAALHGMTWPLLTTASGEKMGKTADGAVWLDAERTSPYKFYQYWINVTDEDVSKCLRHLTDLTREEVEDLDRQREVESHRNASQKKLAEELTRIVHGEDGLAKALRATDVLNHGAPLEGISDHDLQQIFAEAPSADLDRGDLSEGIPVIDGLVATKLCKSKGDARRTIKDGGAYVNSCRVTDMDARLSEEHLVAGNLIVLRRGKKNYGLLRFG